MIDPKDVTIIIPHLGGTDESEYAMAKCYHSLVESAYDIPKIVVANGEKCNEADIKIREQGQCKAVNAAIATTNTPWIFITNDDMVYPPDWFEKLRVYGDPCISAKLVEPRPGAPTFITYFCGGAGGDFDKQKFLDFVESNKDREKGLKTGFNFPLLIKRDLWDLVGGYDINYDPWGSNSDSDLEYKIVLAGVQPVQAQDCWVYHFSQTSGTFEPKNHDAWQRNWDYFINKWGFPRTDQGIWEASFEIPSVIGSPDRKFIPKWEGKYEL